MRLIKETKKYRSYEVDLGTLGRVLVKDPSRYEKGGKLHNGNFTPFSVVKFANPVNGCKSQRECFQEDTLSDLEKDERLINNGFIRGTTFYSNWIKILFVKGGSYSMTFDGKTVDGIYQGHDTYKWNTHYFLVNGQKVKSEKMIYKGYQL